MTQGNKEKVFIGLAINQQTKDSQPCMYSQKNSCIITTSSVSQLAYCQASILGHNWRRKITYENPTTPIVKIGDNYYELIEFNTEAKKIFRDSMSEAFDTL